MDKDTKRKAIDLLIEKKYYPTIAHSTCELRAEHGRRKPVGPGKSIDLGGPEEAPGHGNEGRKPYDAAKDAELRILRETRVPCPRIAMTQSGDYHVEDVIQNPERADEVEKYGLIPRGMTWLGEPYEKEGWVSPVGSPRGPRAGRSAIPGGRLCPGEA